MRFIALLIILIVIFMGFNIYSFSLPELSRIANEKNFFDITGKRIFFTGFEDGKGEIWSPPYQLISNFEVVNEDGKRLIPLKYKITPAYSEITFDDYILTYCPDINRPLFIIKILKKHGNGQIKFKLVSSLRANWPVEVESLGGIETKVYENNKYKILSFERPGKQKTLISTNIENNILVKGNGYAEITLKMIEAQEAYLVIAGVNANEAEGILLQGLSNPVSIINNSINYNLKNLQTFPDFKILGQTPDSKKLEEAIKWAMIAADKTFIETPDVGAGYVAGLNVSEKIAGSGTIPANNGRPGFAWYFGRDFLWMSMPLAYINQWEKIKSNFLLLRKYQRNDGKIMHELTTSVEVMGRDNWEKERYFYASADSTPLYIIALRRYFDASGDIGFIEEMYPSISKAFDYMIKTDYDGDGLIDNFEGHGWVEGGPLAEGQIAKGHTTFYLAYLYVKALQDMEYLSYQLKDQTRQNIALSLIDKAKESLELYWNEKGFYNHRKYPDGTYGLNLTIMPSVGFIFKVTDANRALINLNKINGPDIVTPWGARIISEYDSLYDPTLYHAGNVWPLFSGWLSLADYKYSLSEEGYYLLMTILKNTYDNALGYIGDVFRGDIYENVGCPHQGWSETMGLWPFLEGILGLRFDAINKKLFTKPAFPKNVDKIIINNLHLGAQKLNFTITKSENIYKVKQRNTFKQIEIVLEN
jgi:glycogen debranching enzyme